MHLLETAPCFPCSFQLLMKTAHIYQNVVSVTHVVSVTLSSLIQKITKNGLQGTKLVHLYRKSLKMGCKVPNSTKLTPSMHLDDLWY